MNALTSRPGTPPDSDLISLAEPETEVLQVLHPDVTVSILVTHVENLLESPQKLQQLLLVGKNASFHVSLVRTFVPLQRQPAVKKTAFGTATITKLGPGGPTGTAAAPVT